MPPQRGGGRGAVRYRRWPVVQGGLGPSGPQYQSLISRRHLSQQRPAGSGSGGTALVPHPLEGFWGLTGGITGGHYGQGASEARLAGSGWVGGSGGIPRRAEWWAPGWA